MGVHHALGRTYKDLWQRYNTMLGKRQRYQNGFDCQGLWVEVTVERELGFTSKRDIERYGIRRVRSQVQAKRVLVLRSANQPVASPWLLHGLAKLLLHDVGREQLQHLALSQDMP